MSEPQDDTVSVKQVWSEDQIIAQAEKMGFDPNGAKILFMRMIRKTPGPVRRSTETVHGMFERVAKNVGRENTHTMREEYYDMMVQREFFPNSPTFTGAGTPLGQTAACFVLPISDEMGRTPTGILSIMRYAGLIQQTGGGNGFSFGRLREKGATVGSSNGSSTGPVGFLGAYSAVFKIISQGGSRRGANMAVLPVDHPDIELFIDCKQGGEAKVTNFNISVAVTDAFMEAVRDGKPWNLVSRAPTTFGQTVRTVDARELFSKIARNARANGEPGVLFIDEANRWNPVPELYTLEATNPCGEQWLGPFENCCLGSIKVSAFVIYNPTSKRKELDTERLGRRIAACVSFLDDVVETNGYVPEAPEIRAAAMLCRRIGLGTMGLADLLIELDLRYGSPEALHFCHLLYRFLRYEALCATNELARTKSPAPALKNSIYAPDECEETIERTFRYKYTEADCGHNYLAIGEDRIHDLAQSIKKHGVRNMAQLTVAPTGSIANVTGCEGYGCEPIFMFAYSRNVCNNDDGGETTTTLRYDSKLLRTRLLEAFGGNEDLVSEILEEVAVSSGSCASISRVPEDIRRVFVTAQDVSWEEHVRMQAVIQCSGIDNSISKTINMPPTATAEDVKQAYALAHKLGCKGMTVYVDGTREKVVLEAVKPSSVIRSESTEIVSSSRIHIRSPLGNLYTHVDAREDGNPLSVFFNIGKGGTDANALAEGFGRLISLMLDPDTASMSGTEKLAAIAAQLRGIGGSSSVGLGPQQVRSLPDTMGLALDKYCASRDTLVRKSPSYDLCPECSSRLVRQEGCLKCTSATCGWSRC